jgi:hypothetical protein
VQAEVRSQISKPDFGLAVLSTSERGKTKKLVRSRPTWPAVLSATSIRVRPIEMSKCPASSNTVQCGNFVQR